MNAACHDFTIGCEDDECADFYIARSTRAHVRAKAESREGLRHDYLVTYVMCYQSRFTPRNTAFATTGRRVLQVVI